MLDSGRYLGSKKPPRMPLGLQLLSAFGTRGILERESQTGSIEWGGPGEEERTSDSAGMEGQWYLSSSKSGEDLRISVLRKPFKCFTISVPVHRG